MAGFIGGLLIIALVVFLVAVIGHGIWVLFAHVFRGLLGGQSSQLPQSFERSGAHHELAVTERQIDRMWMQGSLTLAERDQIQAVIAADRERARRGMLSDISQAATATPPTQGAPVDTRPATVGPVEAAAEITEFVDKQTPIAAAAAPSPAALSVRHDAFPPTVPAHPAESVLSGMADEEPKQPFAGVLHAFMEEKNIRWGELISGMLIVGSAVGLVISLWSTLKESIPYFPALLFMLTTAAMHGAGLYTLKRWKLKSTSRGLLIIAALLVPLNCLAAVALSEQSSQTSKLDVSDPRYLIAATIGVLGFGTIAFSSGRALLKNRGWLLFAALAGPSVMQLVIARLADPSATLLRLNLLVAVPVASFVIAAGWEVATLALRRHINQRAIARMFLLIGTGLFSLSMPIALLLWKTGTWEHALSGLSPSLNLAFAVVLAGGVLVHRRATAGALATTRTIGLASASLGGSLMLALVALAWPNPELLIAVGLLDFVLLTFLATVGDAPPLHVPALMALALAALIGMHAWSGEIVLGAADTTGRTLVDLLSMGRSGCLLTVVALCAGSVGLVLTRRRLTGHGLNYLLGSAVLAVGGFAVAVRSGLLPGGVDGDFATAVFAGDALVCLIAAWVFRKAVVSWTAGGLLLLTVVHAVNGNDAVSAALDRAGIELVHPLLAAGLIFATIAALLGLCGWVIGRRKAGGAEATPGLYDPFSGPLGALAIVVMAVGLPEVIFVEDGRFALHAGYALWIAVLLLAPAMVTRVAPLFSAGQLMLTLGAAFTATAVCQRQEWWTGAYLDPRHVEALCGALAGLSLLWTLVRIVFRRLRLAADEMTAGGTSVDRLVLSGSVVVLAVMAFAGCQPGIVAELGTSVPLGIWDWAGMRLSPFDIVITLVMCCIVMATAGVACAGMFDRAPSVAAVLSVPVLLVCFAAVGWLHWQVEKTPLWGSPVSLHVHAIGPGAWWAAGAIGLAVLAQLWDRWTPVSTIRLVTLAAVVVILAAGRWEHQQATASALRWGFALFGMAMAGIYVARGLAARWWETLRCNFDEFEPHQLAITFRNTFLGIAVFFTLMLAWTGMVASHVRPAGEETPAAVFFSRLGPFWSYGVPLWIVAAMLVLVAWRERAVLLTFAASLCVQSGLWMAICTRAWTEGAQLDDVDLVHLVQYSGIALALFGLAWQAVRGGAIGGLFRMAARADRTHQPESPGISAFGAHLNLAAAVVCVPVVWGVILIVRDPGSLPAMTVHLGDWTGFAALVIAAVLLWWNAANKPLERTSAVLFCLMALVVLAASAAAYASTSANWFSYRILSGGWCGLAALATVARSYAVWKKGRQASDRSNEQSVEVTPGFAERVIAAVTHNSVAGWIWAINVIVVLLAVRSEFFDPARPWWSAGLAATTTVIAAALALMHRSQKQAYAATLFAPLTATLIWLEPWLNVGRVHNAQSLVNLAEAIVAASAILGVFWLAVEAYWQRWRESAFDPHSSWWPVHRVVAVSVFVRTSLLVVACATMKTLSGGSAGVNISNTGGGVLIAALGLLMIGLLWDRRAKNAVAGLYAFGLLMMVVVLDGLELRPAKLVLTAACMLAGYILALGVAWTQRARLSRYAADVRIPSTNLDHNSILGWLQPVQIFSAVAVLGVQLLVVILYADDMQRLIAGLSVLPVAMGLALVADGRQRPALQVDALVTAVFGCVYIGWALLDARGFDDGWLDRSVVALTVFAAAALIKTLCVTYLPKEVGDWRDGVRRAAGIMSVLAAAALVFVLMLEAGDYRPDVGTSQSNAQIVVVATAIATLVVTLIWSALRSSDELAPAQRMFYVYAAEAVAALMCVHIRIAAPELFHGYLRPWWPVLVIGIAFGGIGAGEFFRRRGLDVLAIPLHRTGAFLPLLPALGFWALSSNLDYSMALFLVGLVYVCLSMWRQSFAYGLLAGLAGNGALWSLLYERGVTMLAHPQMWLIPPALSVLAAAQVHRRQLGETRLAAVRYLCMTVIYVSSTGEMFLEGVRDSLWLPMVLALLSVSGVFAGIFLRVRAFLYLGSSFLMLSIVSMVWHAAQKLEHVWPWWVFGIVLGLGILTVFGLFEKKRNEALQLFDRIRTWER